MNEQLAVLRLGSSRRLSRLLEHALAGLPARMLSLSDFERSLPGSRILFALHIDEFGAGEELHTLLRLLRKNTNCLSGCVGGILADGDGELYTKSAAQALTLAANLAGCAFPGKPLVEGTGSLYNQHILASRLGLGLEETYFERSRELVRRILQFTPPSFAQPRLLMLHASDQKLSNTVWLGREILARLPSSIESREISLQNGTIFDCRGCSYDACLHFAENGSCFYGGAVSEAVLPAIRSCNAMLFLCPNYNDALSANISALINRLTSLLVTQDLSDKYIYGIVVSGYSGSDLVARQLLGSMCLNKTAILPPRFCLMETAHDAGSAAHIPDISQTLDRFAAQISSTLLGC